MYTAASLARDTASLRAPSTTFTQTFHLPPYQRTHDYSLRVYVYDRYIKQLSSPRKLRRHIARFNPLSCARDTFVLEGGSRSWHRKTRKRLRGAVGETRTWYALLQTTLQREEILGARFPRPSLSDAPHHVDMSNSFSHVFSPRRVRVKENVFSQDNFVLSGFARYS